MNKQIKFPNGLYFVENNKKVIDSLFIQGGTASGTYKVKRNGILFYSLQGKPFAFLVANEGQSKFFVSCHYNTENDKRIRYMFGMMDCDKKTLGLDLIKYGEESDLAYKIWEEFKK